jgi:hypothetical protein
MTAPRQRFRHAIEANPRHIHELAAGEMITLVDACDTQPMPGRVLVRPVLVRRYRLRARSHRLSLAL